MPPGDTTRHATLHRTPTDRWLWLLPIVAIVATEYKFRRRAIDDALGGSIDLMILVELAIYGLIGLWAVWRLAPTRPRLTPLTVVMWGYILTTAVSSLYSTFALLALARAVQLVIIGAVVHVIAVDGRLHQISRLVHGWIVLLTASIAIGLAYVAPTTGPQEGRFTWLFVHSVSAGSMLALSVPMLLGLWLSAGRLDNPVRLPWPRWSYGALLIMHLVFLLATRTRGSIGGACIALALMAWIWTGRRAKPQLVLGGLIAGGASLLAFGEPDVRVPHTRRERRTDRDVQPSDRDLDTGLGIVPRDIRCTASGSRRRKASSSTRPGWAAPTMRLFNVMIDAGLIGLGWWVALLVSVGVAISRDRFGSPTRHLDGRRCRFGPGRPSHPARHVHGQHDQLDHDGGTRRRRERLGHLAVSDGRVDLRAATRRCSAGHGSRRGRRHPYRGRRRPTGPTRLLIADGCRPRQLSRCATLSGVGNDRRVAVIGGGSWGTALARLLAREGVATTIWALEGDVVESIVTERQNSVFLPGIDLPPTLAATTDLDEALAGATVVVSAVPTQHIRSVFSDGRQLLANAELLVSVSKGIEVDTLEMPSQILREVSPSHLADDIVALSGPSFAHEVGLDHPAAVLAAGTSIVRAREVRDLFNTSSFRVYSSDDIVSAELGGALKNVIAIAAGMSSGLGIRAEFQGGVDHPGIGRDHARRRCARR